MKENLKTILAVLAIVTMNVPLAAQDSAKLVVTIQHESEVLSRATALLNSLDEGKSRKKLSDSSGIAEFESLKPGAYSLVVSARGYDKVLREFSLVAGETKNIDVQLQLPQFSETLVITTANRREELLKNVAEPMSVITESDIEASGATTAKELLVDHVGAGVQVANGGGLGHISINGVSQKGVLMLLDGRRILGKNGNGEFSLDDLDLSNIERVEIVKGAGSALYGSDAIAGVVNFITKNPEAYGVSVESRLSAGGNEDYQASSSLAYKDEAIAANLTAAYRSYGGYDLIEETVITEGQAESKYYQFGGDAEFMVSDRLVVRGLFNFNQRSLDDFYREDFMAGFGYFKSTQEISRVTASPEVEYLLTDSTVISARYNYSDYYREETRDYVTYAEEQQPWQEWIHEGQLTVRHNWELNDRPQTFQFGYEYRDENMDRENLAQPDAAGTMASRDIQVLWGQNEFSVADAITVTLGFRYDDYSDFGEEFSPKAGVIFKLNDENRLRATYGHGFRAPNFGELYLDLGFFFKGNPDLKPETSNNFTAGFSHTSNYVSGSIDYFYNQLEDGIVFDLSGFPFTYKNLDELTVSGINADVSFKLPYGLVPSLSYTYTSRENAQGEEIDNYPAHSATLRLNWNLPEYDFNATLRGQYNDDVLFESGNSRPEYQIWYLHARKDFVSTASYRLGVYGQVDNLFDETDFFQRDPAGRIIQDDLLLWFPRRTVSLGVKITFDGF